MAFGAKKFVLERFNACLIYMTLKSPKFEPGHRVWIKQSTNWGQAELLCKPKGSPEFAEKSFEGQQGGRGVRTLQNKRKNTYSFKKNAY